MTAPETAAPDSGSGAPDALGPSALPRHWPLLAWVGFALLAVFVWRGALDGRFISDDGGYIVVNEYLRELSLENVAAFFDPRSPAQLHAVGNYSPVHLLLHAFEWQIFADRTFGYHLVNVLVHAGVAVLFAALLLASRAPPVLALVAALVFLVHPANVQAVAWISQLKSTAGLAFAFGALLVFDRRPGLAWLLFVLALLTKAAASFAIPMLAATLWVRGAPARQWRALAAWVAVFGVYAVVEFAEFSHTGWIAVPAYEDPSVQLRSVAAYAMRYLVMAATSIGVSAYHEPDPVLSWFDPWWLAALPAGALLLWRLFVTLRDRREEGIWWLAAAAGWFPVSQVFPFVHPMGDHYLYFVLPGLLGGLVLWTTPRLARLEGGALRVLAAGAAALVIAFAWHSTARAKLWENDLLLSLDAARNYPDGRNARLLRARSAAQAGDVESALAELRGAQARGMFEFRVLDGDPGLAPLRGHPEYEELTREWAGLWIAHAERVAADTQTQLRVVASAHRRREEWEQAEAAYQRALEIGGREDEVVRAELASLRAQRARREARE